MLGPEHRLLVGADPGGEGAQARVPEGEPLLELRRRGGVHRERGVGGEVRVVGVDRRHARLHARGLGDVRDRAGERYAAVGADQLGTLDPPRARDLPEPAGSDPQPDGALRAVLGSGEELLGHRVQRPAGRGEHVLVHLSS